jgi:hypothetical protein
MHSTRPAGTGRVPLRPAARDRACTRPGETARCARDGQLPVRRELLLVRLGERNVVGVAHHPDHLVGILPERLAHLLQDLLAGLLQVRAAGGEEDLVRHVHAEHVLVALDLEIPLLHFLRELGHHRIVVGDGIVLGLLERVTLAFQAVPFRPQRITLRGQRVGLRLELRQVVLELRDVLREPLLLGVENVSLGFELAVLRCRHASRESGRDQDQRRRCEGVLHGFLLAIRGVAVRGSRASARVFHGRQTQLPHGGIGRVGRNLDPEGGAAVALPAERGRQLRRADQPGSRSGSVLRASR